MQRVIVLCLGLLIPVSTLLADTATVSVSTSGSLRDDGSGHGTPYLGYIDNTWPSSDELYRSYFWWNAANSSGVSSGAAIESATFSVTLSRENYQDDDWFSPRGAKINASRGTWNGWGGGTRYDNLNIDGISPRYYNLGSNPGNPYTQAGINVDRSHFAALRNGDFGLGFNFTDTSGSSGDDATRCIMSATGVSVTFWNTPGLSNPAAGISIETGTPTTFSWGSAMPNYSRLVFRLQISQSSAFASNLYDSTVAATSTSFTPVDGGTYYWRLRIEDPAQGDNVSNWSGIRTFTVTVPPIPAPPSTVDARDGLSVANVRVSWDGITYATVYDVYRSTTNSFGSSSLLGSTSGTFFDDASATPNVIYYYWVKARNSTGSSAQSGSDSGYRANGGSTVVGTDGTGSIWYDHDGDWGTTAGTLMGWADNTFPVDDDHHIAYFWWDGSEIPTGVALDSAIFSSIGLSDAGYEDSDWAFPRAGRIPHSLGTWNATTSAEGRWNLINTVYPSPPHLFSVLTNLAPNPSYSLPNVSMFRSDLPYLLNGQGFGMAFDVTDATGSSGDDSTRMNALVGPMTASYYGMPALLLPAGATNFASGSSATFQWNGVAIFNANLRHRIQIARDTGFSNKVTDALTTALTHTQTLIDGGTYYWRVRIEDKDYGTNASAWTPMRQFTVTQPTSPPSAPTGLAASDSLYIDKVLIAWNPTANASGYQIWRSTTNNAGNAAQIGATAAQSYEDITAIAGTTYYYWVKASNSAGVSSFSSPDTGTRAKDFGLTLTLSPSVQGSLEKDTVFGLAELTSTRFGLDDGDVWNTVYRSHIWWNVSSIPSGAAIESAAITYIGYDSDSFLATSEKHPRALRVGVNKSTFDAGSLQEKFDWLDVSGGTPETALFYRNVTVGEGVRSYNLAFSRSLISQLRANSNFGLAFGSSETDDANREDTNLFQARAGSLTVRYFNTPAVQTPLAGATITSDTPVAFAWNPVLNFAGGSYLRYRLQVSKDANFTQMVLDRLLQAETHVQTFPDNQQYYWRLRIEDTVNAANASSWSPARIFTVPLPLPATPQNLLAGDGTSTTSVPLTWTPVLKASSYQIRRAPTSNLSAITLLGTVASAMYTDTVAAPNTSYTYWVRAINTTGSSTDAQDTGFLGLASPGGIAATDGGHPDHIVISWNAVPNATGYEIWRNTIDNTQSLDSPLASVGSSVFSYTDTTAIDGLNYFYWVKALGAVGNSVLSASNSGYRGLAPPAVISATDGTITGQINLSWSPVVGATSYDLLRAASPQVSSATVIASPTGTSFSDTSASAGQAYYYWMRSKNAEKISDLSVPDAGWRGITTPLFSATDGAFPDRVTVSWNAVSQATGYKVLRGTTANVSSAQVIATLGNVTSHEDNSAAAGTEYTYWVQAMDAVAQSVLATGDAGFLAPSGLTATSGDHGDKVVVNWQAAARATGYTIWRAASNNTSTAAQIGTATNTTYTDTSVTPGTAFWYWVKATLPTGVSGFSNGDTGNPGSAISVVIPVLAQGSIRDGSATVGTPDVGWIDNTWPSSDNHYRAYFWWNTSLVPANVAIEDATIASLGYTKVTYNDSDWSSPVARRLTIEKSTFDASSVSSRWDSLAPADSQPTYFSIPLDEGASHSIANIRVADEDLYKLRNGQSFGLAFTSNDTTGGPGADDTLIRAAAGSINVKYFGAPALLSPASGTDFTSGTTITFTWAAAFPRNGRLQYRAQVATDASFTSLVLNTATNQTQVVFPLRVGNGTTYYWRSRVEDVSMAQLPAAQLHDATQNFSGWTATRTFRLLAPSSAPSAVQGFTASDGNYQGGIRLQWTSNPLAQFYDIYRGTTANFTAATLIQTVGQDVTTWYDTTGTPGTAYYYWVIARNAVGSSPSGPSESGVRGADTVASYFPQSVASGAPRTDSIILWTRVYDAALPTSDHAVSVELATDSAFQNIVRTVSNLQARNAHDHCVKHKVTGLTPYTAYYYRFRYFKPGAASPIYSRTGRTKTAPLPTQNVTARFAFLSCQDRVGRFYNPLQDMVTRYGDTLDFVIYLGDYIYETTGNPEFQNPGTEERSVAFRNPEEAIDLGGHYAARSLSNYRDLYRIYRTDSALQALHEHYPILVMWDDHEFSDDHHGATASYFDEKANEFDPERKRNSEQALLEYMPVDAGMDSFGVAVTPSILYPNLPPLYSTWRYGANCEVLLSDSRSYRPDHLNPESSFPGEIVLAEAELKTAIKAVRGWNDATLNAQWASIRDRYDAYDPDFNPESPFGLIVQAAVIYYYQYEEGLSYADAVGIAKEKVKQGRLSANFVNLALQLANLGVDGYSESEIAGFPRGLSYAYLLKVLPYSPIGARYALLNENFELYAWYRYQQTGGASENLYGDAQTQWINDTLSASNARWKCFVNSVSYTPMLFDLPMLQRMVELDIPSIVPENLLPLLENQVVLNGDALDGFPNARNQMLDALGKNRAVILSGDIHSTWVTRHRSPSGKVIPEFTGSSVSSATPDEFFEKAMDSYPEASGLLSLETFRELFVPLAEYSDQFATSDSEIVDADVASNGYMVTECTSGDMRVTRHELPISYVSESYYGEQMRSRLSEIMHTTVHSVRYNGDTLEMDSGAIQPPEQTYNLSPIIAQSSPLTIPQNLGTYPDLFQTTLLGTDPDGDALSWSLLEPPQHGEVTLQSGTGGLSVAVNYTPNSDYLGADTFLVALTDARGASATIRLYTNFWAAPHAPAVGAATSVGPTSFTANWTSPRYRVTGYRLTLATDSAFSNIVSGFNNLDVGIATSRVLTDLSPGTTYYYRVTASNEAGIGIASEADSVNLPRLDQSISFGALAAATYGDGNLTLSANATSGLAVAFSSDDSSVATITGNTLTIVGAGIATITATQSGNSSYNPAPSVQRTLTVNKASQTLTFGPLAPKAYGDGPFALSAISSSGLQVAFTSDNPSVAAINGNTVTILGAGTATITATQSGNANFNPASSLGQTLLVTARAVTVSNASVVEKTYDGTTSATVTGTLVGVLGGDVVGFSGSGVFDSRDAGLGKAVTSTSSLTGPASTKYTLVQPVGLSGTILAKNLTLSNAAVSSKIYDGTLTAIITGTLSGIVGSDDVVLAGAGAFTSAGVGTNITVISNSTLTGAHAGNYYLTQPSGLTGSITAKALTVANATVTSKTYDGTTDAVITGVLVGVVDSDMVTLQGVGSFSSASVGTNIPVTSTSTLGGAAAGNYSLTQPTGLTGSITSSLLTVSNAAVQAKPYDGTVAAVITGTLTGVATGDDVSLVGTGTFASAQVDAGIAVTANCTLSGPQAANYALSQPEGLTGDITPKAVNLSNAAVQPKVYDGTATATITGTITGLIGADSVMFNGTGTFTSVHAGSGISVTSNSTLSGPQAANYSLVQPTGLTGAITPKPLTVVNAAVQSKLHDGNTNAVITGTLSGIAGSDEVTFIGTGVFASSAVGVGIPVTSTSTLAGTHAGNYSLIQPAGLTGNITTQAVTLSHAMVNNKVYDATTVATVTGTLTGISGSDEVNYIGTGIFASADVGSDIEVTFTGALTGADADKYSLIVPTALKGNILAKELNVADAAVTNKVYDASTSATLTGTLAGVAGSDQITLTSQGTFASPNAGVDIAVTPDCSIAGANAGNYRLIQPAGLTGTITPRAVIIANASVVNKVYDGTRTASITGTLSGVLGTDQVALFGIGTFATAEVGNNIPVLSSSYLTGAAASNYSLIQPDGLAGNILPAPVPGSVSFAAGVYNFNQGTNQAHLILTRSGGTIPFSVRVTTADGTVSTANPPLSAAVAYTDYLPLSAPGTLVNFAEGQTSATLTINLLPRAGTQPNRRFSAALSAATNGATVGGFGTTELRILATDTTKPTVAVTTPAASAVIISTIPSITVTGTATDKNGIDKVLVSLNGAAAAEAELGAVTTTTAGTTVAWSLSVNPAQGSNNLSITAQDARGNASLAATRAFTFRTGGSLTVVRDVPSDQTATPDNVGTYTATGATLAATSNPLVRTATVQLGNTVKLSPTTKTGYVFKGWTTTPEIPLTQGTSNSVTFIMASDVTLTAQWIRNPFLQGVGSYAGHVHARTGVSQPSNATEGHFKASLTNTGTFTGSLLIDGAAYAVSGSFDGVGNSSFGTAKTPTHTIDRTAAGKPNLVLDLTFNAGAGNNQITGSITETAPGNGVCDLIANKAQYSTANLVPTDLLNVTGTAPKGFYTVRLPAVTQTPALDTSLYPQGDGFATLSLTNTGAVTVAGTLADGTALSASGILVSGNQLPLFAQLVTPGAAATVKGGSLSGILVFDTSVANSDVAANADKLLWFRPSVAVNNTNATTAAATNLYTSGWPQGIRIGAIGSKYFAATPVATTLGLGASNSTSGNATLVFTHGKLTSVVTKDKFNIVGNVITKIPTTDASYTLTLTATTGAFSGTFTPNWGSPSTVKPAFKGLLLQKGGSACGWGFFLSNALGDIDPQSGSVILSKKP